MDAEAVGWPVASAAGDRVLRRILAALWGAALAALLFLPSVSLTEGFAFADVASPAARYQQVVMALAGMLAMLGAWQGAWVWGRVMLVALPLLVALGVWEYLDAGGAGWWAWWQPALGCALVGVPAWLLLGRGLEPDRAA